MHAIRHLNHLMRNSSFIALYLIRTTNFDINSIFQTRKKFEKRLELEPYTEYKLYSIHDN